MMKKEGLVYIVIGAAVVCLAGLAILLYSLMPSPSKQPVQASGDEPVIETTQTPTAQAAYFSDTAKVQFFYSETCGWCQKEKEVLGELAKEGYKVKPMDVGTNQDYWKTYNIEGTPTFIAPDGERKVGYQDKDALKEFLDKYK